jgi:hypothetical protein
VHSLRRGCRREDEEERRRRGRELTKGSTITTREAYEEYASRMTMKRSDVSDNSR